MFKKYSLSFLLVVLPFLVVAQFFNGSQTNFGKNRVQHKKLDWSFYKYKKFDVYFYLGGEDLALYTAKRADSFIAEMQKDFDFNLTNKLQFIVYNNLADFEQSNIGLQGNEQYNVGGVTKVIGSKVLFYFDGNYYNLEKQIKEGIARVLLEQLMYGGNITDMVKNSTLIHFPEWYIEGLVSYFSEDWSVEKDNLLQDGMITNRFSKFNDLNDKELVLVGHSLWKYIADKYGRATLPNIIYMAELTRNLDAGFLYVTGKGLKQLKSEWFAEQHHLYTSTLLDRTFPEAENKIILSKKQRIITQIRLNNTAEKLAYTTNDKGKFVIRIYDLETKKVQNIFKTGVIQNEFKYYENPLLAWHPNGEVLSIIVRKKGKMELIDYNITTKKRETRTLHDFSQIISATYNQTGTELLMSAVVKEQSDIFIYNNVSGNIKAITKDIYTDLSPSYTADGKIIFSSDRILDSVSNFLNYIPKAKFDLYLTDKNKAPIVQITNTHGVNEIMAQNYSKNTIFISDSNGVANKFILQAKEIIKSDTSYFEYSSTPISNYASGVLDYTFVNQSKKYAELVFQNNRYHIFLYDSLPIKAKELSNTSYKKGLLNKHITNDSSLVFKPKNIITNQGDTVSIEEVIKNAKLERSLNDTTVIVQKDTVIPFRITQERVYNTVFFVDYVTSQLDNALINETYQKYNPSFPVFFTPGLNGFIKVGISDMFEDKRITGGFKLSGDLSANEYFLSYTNYKRRIDKQFTVHRQSTFQFDERQLFGTRNHIHNANIKYTYPFSRISALSLSTNLRFDRRVELPDNNATLAKPITYNTWLGTKLEYIVDNTVGKGMNLYIGTRGKIYLEVFKDLSTKNSYSTILGTDVRKYTKLYRQIIWANRFSTGTSLGSQRLLYYLGGVDSWFVPKFIPASEIPIDNTQNYIYQTIVPNMRGFAQNIRNGNSFAIYNSEVRIPIIRVLSENPISSDFLYNLQLITFYDLGTAWTGLNPFSEENTLNTQVITKKPVEVTIKNQLNPIVQGYGFGVRSRVGGYFLRADWGYGLEEGVKTSQQFYFSLSTDF